MNVLVRLTRDLRLTDHPALTLAAGLGPVLPAYLVDPAIWSAQVASARQWDMVAETLADLRDQMAAIGLPLLIRVGDTRLLLERLCRQHRIGAIVSQTGPDPARDGDMRDWARGAGIGWHTVAPVGDDAGPPLPVPCLTAVPGVEPGQIPTARSLRLPEDRCAHRQAGGRGRGLALLDSFLAQRGALYREGMADPLLAERSCSRLSPHLSHGALSLREVAQAVTARLADRPGGPWGAALAGFRRSLSARAALQAGPWVGLSDGLHDAESARLPAWTAAETGLPFVDACLRYLQATGWLDGRSRALLIGVATAQLGLPAALAGAHLARLSTDHDPALHDPLVARHAGGLADPVRQGQIRDAQGRFTRRWCPELATVPDEFLQMPWKWSGARHLLGRRYPEPLVDVATALREARALQRRHRPAPMQSRARSDDWEDLIEGPPLPATPRRPRPAPQRAGQMQLDL